MFGNILTFDKESKRKLLYLSADSFIKNNKTAFEHLGLKFLFMSKWKIFLFQKKFI